MTESLTERTGVTEADINDISRNVIDAAIGVHKELGPGLLESVYQQCLFAELSDRGLYVQSELPVQITFKGRKMESDGFRIDLLVQDLIVVELKSVEKVTDVHKKQLLTYLRLANKPLGLLINFNEVKLIDGLTRIINGYF